MDLAAAIALAYGKSMEAWLAFWNGANATQKEQMVQFFIDDQLFWRAVFKQVLPKETKP